MSPTSGSTFAELQQTIDDLRRQLTARTAERDQALAREAATAEVLGVINSSPGDLAPVFDAMLEKALRLCGAAFGVMRTWDGECFLRVAWRGPPELAEANPPVVKPAPGSIAERYVRGDKVVAITDLAQDETFRTSPGAQGIVRAHGARSYLGVPLRKDDKLIGLLAIYRLEVRPYTGKEIALLQNFAAQAVIAMENARLITETREALEQQTATAEVLGVINASPGDLAPVFDAMLEKAMRLCEAQIGAMWTYQDEYMHVSAIQGAPPAYAEFLRETPAHPISGAHRRLLSGDHFIHDADVTTSETYRSGHPVYCAAADLGGIRTFLGVPLRKDDKLLGHFGIYRQEVRPFTDKQIALLQNFAAQAVIAMENARLITETREALEQQTATAEVLGVINSSPGDLSPVFDAIVQKAMHLCDAAFGYMVISDGDAFRTVATLRVPTEYAEFRTRNPVQPGQPGIAARIRAGEPFVHIFDLKDDDLYREGDPQRRAMVDLGGARSGLTVALEKGGEAVGTIDVYRQEVRPFTEKQIALLQNFAAQAVIAMENARLITETREALEQQTATAEVLGVINSSPGDLAPVFDAMLEKALRLCGSDLGNLLTYSGECFEAAVGVYGSAWIGPERELSRAQIRPVPGGLLDRLVAGEHFIHTEDVRTDIAYQRNPEFRDLVDGGGYQSMTHVALRKESQLLGAIVIFFKERRRLTEKQIALLQNFAAQAVIAMENARLITETREALEQQTATAEVLQVINASPGDLAPVFDAILEKAHRLCGAEFGHLSLYNGEIFRAAAVRTPPGAAAMADGLRRGFRGSEAPVSRPLLDGADFVQIQDLAELDHQLARAANEIAGIRTLLAVPLRRDDTLLGMIVAARQEVRPFTDKQIALLQNFAAQAVIAMENARLLGELRQRTEEVAELNRGLEARVAEQVEELGRVGRLKRFLAPQLAELIVSQGDEKILESHRREIVVVFCDLRGYTAFTETAEPEEVLDFLREYHGALGPLVSQFEGTLDQFSGDGIMVFFNDPLPIPNPAERAVNMAVAMREAAGSLITAWRERGRDLGFSCGVAQGYATLGQIGFSERSGYTAIGTVCNVAARLCAEAKDGQILLSQRVNVALKGSVVTEQVGALALKGLTQPVIAFNVPLAASQPALRVIEGGPQNA